MKKTKIVCTIGRVEGDPEEKIRKFIKSGMDVARINMAHYHLENEVDETYLKGLIEAIRKESRNFNVAILGDIQGPKIRIKELFGVENPDSMITLSKDEEFILTSEDKVAKEKAEVGKKGAIIKHEGVFKFFVDAKETYTREKDDEGNLKPIEFWIGDGKVILEASFDQIHDSWAECKVQVPGELKKGKGVTPKNSRIRPGEYSLAKYKKDRLDVKFLVEQKVDFLALSFVNSKSDVKNLQEFAKLQDGWSEIERELRMQEFPIFSKIETSEGYKNLKEIIDASYGILVARGDLALQTGIDKVGIIQKDIIERCVAEGKPVITATQMLLSMMEFKEPRRSEVADVTNAVQDGSDALMLSEETADRDSKYPVESIKMMKKIIITTEEKRAENRIDYKYEIDKQHAKAMSVLKLEKSELEKDCGSEPYSFDHFECIDRTRKCNDEENTEHISYDACKTTYELKCSAIIALTDTGRTARMISRFGPDKPIIAGVYDDRIARILRVSYGVIPFKIKYDPNDNPFNELTQVVSEAKASQLLKEGDRVILVGGYPKATTFHRYI